MHKIAGKTWSEEIFRPYDIRGSYPDEINEDAAYKIARAFVRYLNMGIKEKNQLTILVSADARSSSPALKKAFLDGLLNEGAEVLDSGLTTTPMHYFAVNHTGADGGAMITASHIPQPANGIKLSKKGAMPIYGGGGMEELRNDALRGIFVNAGTRGFVKNINLLDEYVNFLKNHFTALEECELKIILDPGNGMASILLQKLFSNFPKINAEFLHDELDLSFPHHEANPLKPETTADVQEKIKKGKYDLGISFDADGDRVGFIDEKGRRIGGDIITAIFSRYFAAPNGAVVYDLRSSRAVREEIERLRMRPIESRVGHSFIKAAMRKEDAVLGGELSGHYYFKDFFFADSAIFAMLTMLSILQLENKPVGKIIKTLTRYYKTEEINFEVSDKEKTLDNVAAHFSDTKVSYLDGIKVEYDDWWFNLRPAANENLLRLNLEADTQELLDEKKKLIEELLK